MTAPPCPPYSALKVCVRTLTCANSSRPRKNPEAPAGEKPQTGSVASIPSIRTFVKLGRVPFIALAPSCNSKATRVHYRDQERLQAQARTPSRMRVADCLRSLGHKNRGCERRHCGGSRFRVKCGMPRSWIAGILLHRMQMQRQALQLAICESYRRVRRVEEHHDVFVNSI